MVTVVNNPSGTLATIIPIPKTTLVIASYPKMNPSTKNVIPVHTAIIVIALMNRLISFFKGDKSLVAVEARFAI